MPRATANNQWTLRIRLRDAVIPLKAAPECPDPCGSSRDPTSGRCRPAAKSRFFPPATNPDLEIVRILKYLLDVMYYTRYDPMDMTRQDA